MKRISFAKRRKEISGYCILSCDGMNRKLLVILVISVLVLSACRSGKKAEQPLAPIGMEQYAPGKYFSPQEGDSLMVDLVTYIGVKPGGATSQTRFEPRFRTYYTQQAKQFKMLFLHKSEEALYYYYLLRPARDLKGDRRGVGGRFRMEDGRIECFEELFNTPAGDEESLGHIGESLFPELVKEGNADRFLGNNQYIEWPDERLKYDKELHEWRYDVQ